MFQREELRRQKFGAESFGVEYEKNIPLEAIASEVLAFKKIFLTDVTKSAKENENKKKNKTLT